MRTDRASRCAASAGCSTSSPPITATGTCSDSSATSCAGRGARSPLVGDRKTGFCLGDRYAVVGRPLRHRASHPSFRSRCGLDQTQLLGIREGISVGYGDDYAANLEGQYLPLTGLADGRYVLVHRVNGDRRIHETDYANNAASVAIVLNWRQGIPYVRLVGSCPGSARCRRGA